MKEIKFDKINSLKNDDLLNNSVYLLYGEGFLYRKIVDKIVGLVLSDDEKDLNFEQFDSSMDDISDVFESLSTYSFFSEKKVVHLHDSKLFHSKKDEKEFLEKSKKHFDNGELNKASKSFINYLSFKGENLESRDFLNEKVKKDNWIGTVIEYCRDRNYKVAKSEDDSRVIIDIIDNILDNRYFILTSDKTDKKNSIFKSFKKNGIVVDCSVSKSDRKDDKKKQDEILRLNAKEKLEAANKTINNDAISKLIHITGFKLETFNDNLEKLINFSGKRNKITLGDVNNILKRTRTDPIYELTGAISDKKINESLFFLNSLLKENYHPLQILSAISNQIRRLLVGRDFINSSYGKSWSSNCTYNQFRDVVMPCVIEYDQKFREKVKENKKISEKKESDLYLAKNPNSPYPVFLLLKNCAKFSLNDLMKIHGEISAADKLLKNSGSDHILVIEKLIFMICGN